MLFSPPLPVVGRAYVMAAALVLPSAAAASTDPANFATVINAPPTVIGDDESIGSDTQLNVSLGGEVGTGFAAGAQDGSSTNVEVNLSGGSLGGSFNAYAGSTLNVSGGTIALDFTAHAGSTVNLAGGTQAIGFKALPGSDARLIGGEFRLNGTAYTGPAVTLGERDYLTGTLLDGSPFLFSPTTNASGIAIDPVFGVAAESVTDRLDAVSLVRQTLPAADPTPIVIDAPSDAVPKGLRAGQTLTLRDGGEIAEPFTAVGAALNITGGVVAAALEVADSELTISGGVFAPGLGVYGDSAVHITGGRFGVTIDPDDPRVFRVGSFGTAVNAGSTLHISGGRFSAGLIANPGGRLNVSGGDIDNPSMDLIAYAGSTVNLIGTEFALDGVPITGLALNDPVVLADRDARLSGQLLDGRSFSFLLGTDPSRFVFEDGYVDPDATLILTLVPEPGAAVLCGAAMVLFRTRRRPSPTP